MGFNNADIWADSLRRDTSNDFRKNYRLVLAVKHNINLRQCDNGGKFELDKRLHGAIFTWTRGLYGGRRICGRCGYG